MPAKSFDNSDRGGYVLIHRSIMQKYDYRGEPFTRQMAWIHMLMIANYKKELFRKKGIKIQLYRGEFAVTIGTLSSVFMWGEKKTKRFLEELQEEEQILYFGNNLTTYVSIINYDKYQPKNEHNGRAEGRPGGVAEFKKTFGFGKMKLSKKELQKAQQKAEQKNVVSNSKSIHFENDTGNNGGAEVTPEDTPDHLAEGSAEGSAEGVHLNKTNEVNEVNEVIQEINKEKFTFKKIMKKESNYALREMSDIYSEIYPGYAADFEMDAPALLKILNFTARQMRLTDPLGHNKPEILAKWREIGEKVQQDPFYANKTLATISNNIQIFFNKTPKIQENGTEFSKNQPEFDGSGDISGLTIHPINQKQTGTGGRVTGNASEERFAAIRNFGSNHGNQSAAQ